MVKRAKEFEVKDKTPDSKNKKGHITRGKGVRVTSDHCSETSSVSDRQKPRCRATDHRKAHLGHTWQDLRTPRLSSDKLPWGCGAPAHSWSGRGLWRHHQSGAEAFSPGSSGSHAPPRSSQVSRFFNSIDLHDHKERIDSFIVKNLKQIQQDLCWPTPRICLRPLLSQ